MTKYIKQLTPLLYALLVILVFSLLGVFWFKVKSTYISEPSQQDQAAGTYIPDSVKEVKKDEPSRGESKAKYVLIEYSDYDCPFCKDFHTNMKELISQNKDFRWVFRQFPLAQLHPNATEKAKIAVCVNSTDGNDKFWQLSDAMYENQDMSIDEVKQKAFELGTDSDKLAKCLDNFDNKEFNKTFSDANAIGITGTPSTVIVNTDNGKTTLVVGALSAEQIIEEAKTLE